MNKAIRFTVSDAQKAGDDWGFNCGPAAICAIMDMTPNGIRSSLLDFEQKGYTDPTLMRNILNGLKVPYLWEVVPIQYPPCNLWPDNSLIRIQWGGPWTNPGVPMAARYRHTHWIACRHVGDGTVQIFDVNATCVGGWIPMKEWTGELVPWLLKEVEPKADGGWWQTHRAVVKVTP